MGLLSGTQYAQADVNACALHGDYQFSASSSSAAYQQITGKFTFNDTLFCTNQGTVTVVLTVVGADGQAQTLNFPSSLFTIDSNGLLTVDLQGLKLTGHLSLFGDAGTAYGIVFGAAAGSLLFSGTAARVSAADIISVEQLVGPQGPQGEPGPAGPAGPAGTPSLA